MEQILWSATRGGSRVVCSVSRGCSGVRLQVTAEGEAVRREQHPDSSTAYERARHLLADFERDGYSPEK